MMKTKSKAAKVLDILFIIDAIIIIYYSTTFPTDRFDLLSIIVMAVLILALFAFAVFSFVARANLRKKDLLAYVPLRNIQIEKGKEVVLIKNGVALYPEVDEDIEIKDIDPSFAKEPEANVLPNPKINVALIHIDQVDKEKVVFRVFKSPVALIDVSHHINK